MKFFEKFKEKPPTRTNKFMLLRHQIGDTTVGEFYDLNYDLICYTIEHRWFHNDRDVSCVPEGTYTLRKRTDSPKMKSLKMPFGYQVMDVPDRDHILIHIGNSLDDTLGCILPVSAIHLNTDGTVFGPNSRVAVNKLHESLYDECKLEICYPKSSR